MCRCFLVYCSLKNRIYSFIYLFCATKAFIDMNASVSNDAYNFFIYLSAGGGRASLAPPWADLR